jgi:3-oxoacyl-[acyl-carrier-protein] synthase III
MRQTVMSRIEMKIQAVAAAFPQRVVSNDEILQIVEARSRDGFEGDLPKALQATKMFLEYTGAKNRRWVAPGENVFRYTEQAVMKAMHQANVDLSAVDLLIHCGVDRRVVEPGQSFFIAKALGMRDVECFDVLEACASWMRCMQLARMFIKSGRYKNVLVVTAEFAVHEGEWAHRNFCLSNMGDLEWAFPSYTVGESATATLLGATDEEDCWKFDFVGMPQHAELCMCPIDDYADEVAVMNGTSLKGKGGKRFVSYGKQLREVGLEAMRGLLERSRDDITRTDIVFPHTQQRRSWVEDAQRMKVDMPFYFIYPEYGNIVSSSIPAAMALAEAEGRLTRGAEVGVLMAAAGMSLSLATFRY